MLSECLSFHIQLFISSFFQDNISYKSRQISILSFWAVIYLILLNRAYVFELILYLSKLFLWRTASPETDSNFQIESVFWVKTLTPRLRYWIFVTNVRMNILGKTCQYLYRIPNHIPHSLLKDCAESRDVI